MPKFCVGQTLRIISSSSCIGLIGEVVGVYSQVSGSRYLLKTTDHRGYKVASMDVLKVQDMYNCRIDPNFRYIAPLEEALVANVLDKPAISAMLVTKYEQV